MFIDVKVVKFLYVEKMYGLVGRLSLLTSMLYHSVYDQIHVQKEIMNVQKEIMDVQKEIMNVQREIMDVQREIMNV